MYLLLLSVVLAVFVLLVLLPMIKTKILGRSNSGNDIPGLNTKDIKHGNLDLVKKHGNLHEFLLWLHQQYGPIAKFWFGEQMVVSIASPQLFKETSHMFDRPPVLYEFLVPLITRKSIQVTNKEEGKWKRKTYDPCYSHRYVMEYMPVFQRLAEEMVEEWSRLPRGQHVPCRQEVLLLALKAITQCSFGDYIQEGEQVVKFWEAFETCWLDFDKRLRGDEPNPGSEREKKFNDDIHHKISKFRS
ncbi:cytochrome P450 20A1-like [Lingula anatina]|uniref:Cytochrome P450 20A1-like n=1 Tax=Lingula anatina TaxID=7574 RepID=A0A1S3H7S5_LINAN|nr:cytochrome P450 20A1-like [Lingula anatina]|eukprot:XP_013381169.1 cytochrome P450 20A1-like [Lingula anatina]